MAAVPPVAGWQRALKGGALALFLVLAVALLAEAAEAAWLEAAKGWYQQLLPESWRVNLWRLRQHLDFAREVYLSPWTYAVVAAVFALERRYPVVAAQPVMSRGLAQDFLWFNVSLVFRTFAVAAYISLLYGFYQKHLSFLTLQSVAAWPIAVRTVLGFLLFDFLNYVHHVVRHRVTVLWYFHMIHHSQREMNLFTDARVHPVEPLVTKAIMFIPLFALPLEGATVFWFTFLTDWYSRVYHANLRSNYGVLKHVLVTPQSHRIHHSRELQHYDRNFGLFLTVWDRLFGTLYAKYDEYPATGVDVDDFPLEQTVEGALGWVRAFGGQLAYPFKRAWQLVDPRRAVV